VAEKVGITERAVQRIVHRTRAHRPPQPLSSPPRTPPATPRRSPPQCGAIARADTGVNSTGNQAILRTDLYLRGLGVDFRLLPVPQFSEIEK
jgi:hypothetical protein